MKQFFKDLKGALITGSAVGDTSSWALSGDRLDAVEAAKRFTRGNVPIQNGEFLSLDRLEAERRDMNDHPLPRL